MKQKYKVLIALSLALVMIVTLASPILAGKPEKGLMTKYPGQTGWGKYALQATHDNPLKATIVLRGALPNETYKILLWYENTSPPGNSWYFHDIDLTTDEKGNLRFSDKLGEWTTGTIYFQLELLASPYVWPGDIAYVGGIETITFK